MPGLNLFPAFGNQPPAARVRLLERRSRMPYRQSIAGLFLLLLAGCGTVKSPTEPPPATGGGTAFTFTRIQTQIFTPVCAKAGCHAAGSAPSGLVLEAGQSYGDLVGHRSTENGSLDRV